MYGKRVATVWKPSASFGRRFGRSRTMWPPSLDQTPNRRIASGPSTRVTRSCFAEDVFLPRRSLAELGSSSQGPPSWWLKQSLQEQPVQQLPPHPRRECRVDITDKHQRTTTPTKSPIDPQRQVQRALNSSTPWKKPCATCALRGTPPMATTMGSDHESPRWPRVRRRLRGLRQPKRCTPKASGCELAQGDPCASINIKGPRRARPRSAPRANTDRTMPREPCHKPLRVRSHAREQERAQR